MLPAETRGTVNSLRLMGNRAGQVLIPLAAGAVAAAAGASGVFLMVGTALAGVWALVQFGASELKRR